MPDAVTLTALDEGLTVASANIAGLAGSVQSVRLEFDRITSVGMTAADAAGIGLCWSSTTTSGQSAHIGLRRASRRGLVRVLQVGCRQSIVRLFLCCDPQGMQVLLIYSARFKSNSGLSSHL